MPELPEVETTVRSLNKHIRGLAIKDVWSSYNSAFHSGKNNIKDRKYFEKFKKEIAGKKFLSAERKAKNIIINLSGGISILVHMKMTGHFLYGTYRKNPKSETQNPKQIQNIKSKIQNEEWVPAETGPLEDPMNRFIRLIFTLSNKKHLAFSDLRRFAKIYCFPTSKKDTLKDIKDVGPEPLAKNFFFEIFRERLLLRPAGKIKQVLMDQSVIAGIGNIYSDEILWAAGVHPLSAVSKIPKRKLKVAFEAMIEILTKAIKIGGDSTSDFRGIDGRPGSYQNFHKAYRQTGKLCPKPHCQGKIVRIKIGGRSAHFCPVHQIKY